MAGDTVSLATKAWYNGSTQAPPSGLTPIGDEIVSLLTSGVVAAGGTHGGNIPAGDISDGVTAVVNDFLSNQSYDNSKPKAFLNWMVVDEDFKKVTSTNHMGAVQVPTIASGDSNHLLVGPTNMVVRRGGWLYVYVSNESNQNVFFDNIVASHKRGPVVEQSDYYAFGLEILGISSKAAVAAEYDVNRKKFQGQEYTTDLDVDYYEFKYRFHDPSIGRFIQIDPLASDYVYNSTYAFSENKVTSSVELEGLESLSLADVWRAGGISASSDPIQFTKNAGKEALKPQNWINGYAKAGEIVAPLVLVGIMTEGAGEGTMLQAEARSMSLKSDFAPTPSGTLATADPAAATPEVNLAQRATEIHSTLPPETQGFNTTAVASATDANGNSVTLVGSNEKNPGKFSYCAKGSCKLRKNGEQV